MLQLTPSAIKTAKENLRSYVEKAKTLDVMSAEGAPNWDEPAWDISTLTKRPNEAAETPPVLFKSLKVTKGGSNTNAPYGRDIGDALKAFLAHKMDERYGGSKRYSYKTIVSISNINRGLIDALVDKYSVECLTDVQAWQIEEYLREVKDSSNYSRLRAFLVVLRNQNILPQISGLEMKAPSARKSGEAASSARVPTNWDEIVALGSAFYKSAFAPGCNDVHPKIRFWASCATLLATTPSRQAELWRLPANLEVVNDPASAFEPDYSPLMHEDKSFKYGLRWWPVKGGQPLVKFVPTPMVKVAQRAIEIIKEHTDEPRELANWIIENPGKLPIPKEHSDIELCRATGIITADQIERLFGVREARLSHVKRWKRHYKKTQATRKISGNSKTGQVYFYNFNTFEADWVEDFKRGFPTWPMVVDDKGLKLRADEALMVCFDGELDPRVVHKSKIFLEIPKQSSFSDALASSEQKTASNIFEDLDIRLPDDSHAHIQSHDLRHFLNTIAQMAGVPQKIIAAWSGRKDIAQNMVYDHRSDAERVKAIGAGYDYDALTAEDLMHHQMKVFEGEIAPPSTNVLLAEQSNFNQVRKQLFVSITHAGFCLGNLHEDPCPSAQNCISCSRHMICAGATKSKEIFEEKARIMNRQHDELKKGLSEGRRGITEELVEHMSLQCQGANEMLLALNDRETEDGTLIRRADYIGAQTTRFTDRVIEHRAERLAVSKQGKEISGG